MSIQKLVKIGEECGVVIPQSILDRLKIDLETPLEIFTDGESLIVLPVHEGVESLSFRAAVKELHARYGEMLRRLA